MTLVFLVFGAFLQQLFQMKADVLKPFCLSFFINILGWSHLELVVLPGPGREAAFGA